jgi:hypothetical protein
MSSPEILPALKAACLASTLSEMQIARYYRIQELFNSQQLHQYLEQAFLATPVQRKEVIETTQKLLDKEVEPILNALRLQLVKIPSMNSIKDNLMVGMFFSLQLDNDKIREGLQIIITDLETKYQELNILLCRNSVANDN